MEGQKAKEVEDTGFKLWYTGATPGRNDVGILIDRSLNDGVVEVRRQGDRIILIRLVVGDSVLNIISAYAPQVGLSESTKNQFWEYLNSLVSIVPGKSGRVALIHEPKWEANRCLGVT